MLPFSQIYHILYIYIFAVATAQLAIRLPTIRENRGVYFESQTIKILCL